MQVTPRYDGSPVLRLEGPIGDPSIPLLRQRRRLADVLATLDRQQWAAPSRCEHWSVQDVIAHLGGINELWQISIIGACRLAPTRLFQSFDPVAMPAQMVEALRGWTPEQTLAHFVETTDALATAVAELDDAAWVLIGETPLGHVGLHLVALHALWDSWLHERDVLIPLGLTTVDETDEVIACLTYAAALSPALLAAGGSTSDLTLEVDATDPDLRLRIEAGTSVVVHPGPAPRDAVRVAGPSVDLIEWLSFRAPPTVEVTAADRWPLGGLATAFDRA